MLSMGGRGTLDDLFRTPNLLESSVRGRGDLHDLVCTECEIFVWGLIPAFAIVLTNDPLPGWIGISLELRAFVPDFSNIRFDIIYDDPVGFARGDFNILKVRAEPL